MDFRQARDFIKNRFLVRDRENPDELVRFIPNFAQEKLFATCRELADQRRPIRVICGKSRRVGISRGVTALGICYMFAYPNFEARVMAHFDETAHDILSAGALMALGDGRQGYGLPARRRHEFWDPGREYKSVLVPHRTEGGFTNSQMQRASAKTRGKGRGLGFSFYQGSEVAYYPVDTPFTAVLPALARSLERSAAFLESTGNGMVGEGEAFYKYWQGASELKKRGDSEWVRFFLSVIDDPMARSRQVPQDIPRDDEERALLRAHVPKEYIAYRRSEIATTYKGIVEDYEQENPETPTQMFIAGGLPAFASEERDWACKYVCEPKITCELERTRDPWVVRLSPMGTRGRIKIWKLPEPHHEYYIGVDLARGQDMKAENAPPGDFAAIYVLDGTTGEQAAKYSDRVDPAKMAEIVDLMGRFYRTPEIAANHCALLNIEVNANLGAECQRLLRDRYAYPIWRFARWKGSKDDRYHAKAGAALGWETTQTSRKIMFASFRVSMRERQLVIYDEELAQQICAASMNDGKWEITRGHDDVLVSALLAWIARQQFPPRTVLARKEMPDVPHPFAEFDTLAAIPLVGTLARNEQKDLEQMMKGRMQQANDPFAKYLGEPILPS